MHIHFIFPRWSKLLEDFPELQGALAVSEFGSFRMAGLGAATAAGAVPDGHTVTLLDENVNPVDYAIRPDLVGIGFFTPQAGQACRIADRFRALEIPTIAGGIHPTMAPEDVSPHFDSIVRGPVEGLWPTILGDLETSAVQPVYWGSHTAPFAPPRRDLFAGSGYLKADVVQTARGCPVNCPFCVLPSGFGTRICAKPIPRILEDIQGLEHGCYYFADENLLFGDSANRAGRTELMECLIGANIRKIFFAAAYPFMAMGLTAADLGLLRAAGCRQIYLILGLKDPLIVELGDPALRQAILRLKQAGIEIMATFTLGHDGDSLEPGSLIEDFCSHTRTNLFEFTLRTPFPGTPEFKALHRDGRILHQTWEKYNGAHVVFRPLSESPEALQSRYGELWRIYYGGMSRFEVHRRLAKGFSTSILKS